MFLCRHYMHDVLFIDCLFIFSFDNNNNILSHWLFTCYLCGLLARLYLCRSMLLLLLSNDLLSKQLKLKSCSSLMILDLNLNLTWPVELDPPVACPGPDIHVSNHSGWPADGWNCYHALPLHTVNLNEMIDIIVSWNMWKATPISWETTSPQHLPSIGELASLLSLPITREYPALSTQYSIQITQHHRPDIIRSTLPLQPSSHEWCCSFPLPYRNWFT